MKEPNERLIKLALIQLGPATEDKEKNLKNVLRLIDEGAKKEPDFITLSELSTTPYFCTVQDAKYLNWAETIPGPTTNALAEKAKKYGCCILVPLLRKGAIEREYYNSVVVIGQDGMLVQGTLPDGRKVNSYDKAHLPKVETPKISLDEKFYFKQGIGFPVFKTSKASIGILLCYDRRFPEAWRTLALRGAEIVFMCSCIPEWEPSKTATSGGTFTIELQTRAMENLFFVAACNKGGREIFMGKETLYFGRSCVIDPAGTIVKEASSDKPEILSVTVNLGEIEKARKVLPIYKDRRPETYLPVVEG